MLGALRLMASALCAAGISGSAALAKEGSLVLPEQPSDPVILTSASTEMFRVYVGTPDECCAGRSPLAGRYEHEGPGVSFAPAFDFVEGQPYTVLSNGVMTTFTLGEVDQAAPEVVAVYPSGDAIPENTLRFYVHFSAPMQPHLAEENIKLVDATGVEDIAAFMTFKQELWNADRTRLTLLMDPGRIKRGVAQNQSLGPALLEGRSYALVIEGGWPAVHGGQNSPRFEKAFHVSAPLRTLPNLKTWSLSEPRAMTRAPLVVRFDRAFDRHGLATAITVLDASGRIIDGHARVGRDQTEWRFVPRVPWVGNHIDIHVDTRLEDVAGNNFRDLLDHALGTAAQSGDTVTRRVMLAE
ncbi:MAG: hypothetical protein OXC60_06215 [Litoreibacter sp.]|nr:hypothetical protein [Litoreibacter sp.]